jgi:hypothetical protein
MEHDELIDSLAVSYLNGNISHVVNTIGNIRQPELTAYIAVGVYDKLADQYGINKPMTARTFMNALARHAAVTG